MTRHRLSASGLAVPVLLCLAALSVALSLFEAAWAPGLAMLPWLVLAAIAFGWFSVRTLLPSWVLHLVSLALGFILAVFLAGRFVIGNLALGEAAQLVVYRLGRWMHSAYYGLPSDDALPFSLLLGLLSVSLATPVGVATAIFLTEYTREGLLTRVVRTGTEALAGVPSIIFGLFGFVFFVIYLGMGWSVLSGSLTLAIMILPTIVRTAEEAILTVPRPYREVSYSLGATRWQMVTTVVLPAALPGIVTGVVLGLGRTVGETAAVILTAGAALHMPNSLFSPARTMAVHFYILAREGISDPMAWATGSVLVVTILAINVVINRLSTRLVRRRARR